MPLNQSIRTRSAATAATLLLALLASAQAAAQGLPPLPGQQMAASDGRGQAQAQARYDFATKAATRACSCLTTAGTRASSCRPG
jgi:hypothetical protein